MLVNAAIHLCGIALLVVLLGRLLDRASLLLFLAFATLLFATPLGWDNTLGGFQIQFYYLILLSLLEPASPLRRARLVAALADRNAGRDGGLFLHGVGRAGPAGGGDPDARAARGRPALRGTRADRARSAHRAVVRAAERRAELHAERGRSRPYDRPAAQLGHAFGELADRGGELADRLAHHPGGADPCAADDLCVAFPRAAKRHRRPPLVRHRARRVGGGADLRALLRAHGGRDRVALCRHLPDRHRAQWRRAALPAAPSARRAIQPSADPAGGDLAVRRDARHRAEGDQPGRGRDRGAPLAPDRSRPRT